MNLFKVLGGLSAMACLLAAHAVSAQTTADGHINDARTLYSDVPVIYVGDFQTVASSTETASGPFARLHAKHDAKKIDANAQTLAEAVIKSLQKKGLTAVSLSSTQRAPTAGLLVDGTYAQTISHSLFPMISALAQSGKPNTDATVRITDLDATHAGTPTSFTSDATLKGQGTSLSTNPYKLVAHIVIKHIEASTSMNALADSIADSIVAADPHDLRPMPTTAYVAASRSP